MERSWGLAGKTSTVKPTRVRSAGKSGSSTADQKATRPPGATTRLAFAPNTSTISLTTNEAAEVWIDGEKIGETPIGNYELSLGTHDVLFRHPDLGEQHYTTTVTLKAPARLSVDLRKK